MDIAAERSYPTPFANSTLLPLLLLSLARQKNAPTVSTTIKAEYDYIVVGAGSAGSVMASRLSELHCVSVLLLEAGKSPPILNDVPGIGRSFWGTDLDWSYKTVPQKETGSGLKNKQVIWRAGKALGGSSILNEMLVVRGSRKNYDDWAEGGAKGWSYKDVLPYFRKIEDNQDPEYIANGFHGTSGPMTVERPRFDSEIRSPVVEAAELLGHRVVDLNDGISLGFFDVQCTMRDGQRCSVAKGYLVPAENRTNLDILTNAFVKEIVIKERKATGVIFDFENETYEVKARREVIVSAGAVNSPHLLMVSGIGPREHLEEMNISVIADLPVGENLHDHFATPLLFALDDIFPTFDEQFKDWQNLNQYIQNRTGLLASADGITTLAFMNGLDTTPIFGVPNYGLYFFQSNIQSVRDQFGLTPEAFEQLFGPYEKSPFFICFSSVVLPKSRGNLKLQTTNPYDPPLIDPNYFADQSDIQDMIEGLKMCQRIAASEPMQKIGAKLFQTTFLGCEDYSDDEDKLLECLVRSVVLSLSHQSGTVKMGDPEDPATVLDPQLRVKGIEGLRVVDASVMPFAPSGNVNIPTIMIAEKTSDIIKETIKCIPYSAPKYNVSRYEGHFKTIRDFYACK